MSVIPMEQTRTTASTPARPVEVLAHPAREELELGAVLAALADPIRRSVVARLAQEPDGFEQHCSAFGLPVTKQTRTYHFRVLRAAGLIWMHDHGNGVLTSLRRADLDARFPGLLELVVAAAAERPTKG
ncbi:MAG: ArsR/SmtB family transcription factor [Acidimicrobiales bacterium]